MNKIFTFLLLLLLLCGCNSNGINDKLFKEGEKYANQIYQIKYGIIDLDNKGLEKYLNQDKTNLNNKEKQYVKLIGDFFIQWTIYIADKQADGKLDKETEDKFMKIANKLKNEYGVNLKER
ncbi:hypothetical protein [Thermaerobacillus caldiproteolyticus]|uniref:Putative ABC-type transport system involved in lysophospholipase L1 biosynthesis ATPase subunit n=1 Tax=Thermaerobacillus caldiproteolyticus TaxID=247480 RepID=A0A7V9ZA85_9BACL|nr:hypothetical protein [Anoxybacillus caldiproteolyticus]MBA2876868.1 putative ABC-type transport system involved in lysophospholipase L1 biosynthesis ATPase subunit [Anoxybacillus caldiproteolyticus]